MLVCPNCNHQNPAGAVQCEACYTPLPAIVNCPNCGAAVQADASFCGQCGFNLKSVAGTSSMSNSSEMPDPQPSFPSESIVPDPLVTPDPLVFPESPTINVHKGGSNPDKSAPSASEGRVEPTPPLVSPPE